MNRVSASIATQSLPELVQAQNLAKVELDRLTKDPVFGKINKIKIMSTEQRIKDKQTIEKNEFNKAMKLFKKK